MPPHPRAPEGQSHSQSQLSGYPGVILTLVVLGAVTSQNAEGGLDREPLLKQPRDIIKWGLPGTRRCTAFLPCHCLFQINFLRLWLPCKQAEEASSIMTALPLGGLAQGRGKGCLSVPFPSFQ